MKASINLLFVFSLLLVSCSSGTTALGLIEVRITDHREAIDDFESLDITIERIGLHPASAARADDWIDLQPDTAVVDLTQVLDGRTKTVLEASLPAGDYDAIRLHVSSAEGDLKVGESVTVRDFEQAVRMPFSARADTPIVIVIDIIVESQDDHPGRGYEINIADAVIVGENE